MELGFDFEEKIASCWSLTEDIQSLIDGVSEYNLSRDQIINILVGMKDLYDLRFNILFDEFEHALKNRGVTVGTQVQWTES